MGTRHLITIVKDGEFKLAQYGQWDGMPFHQGSRILAFLKNGDLEALEKGVDKLFYCTEAEIDLLQQEAGVPAGQDWLDSAQSDRIKAMFPTIHRDAGAGIFDILEEGSSASRHHLPAREGLIPTENNIVLAGRPDLEWVYTVDLDSGTFETYRAGCDTELEPTRFSDLIKEAYEGSDEEPCYLQLVGSYRLDDLPSRHDYRLSTDPEGSRRYLDYYAEVGIKEEPEYPDQDSAAESGNENDGGTPSIGM